jgi:hypothetical protein
MRERVASLRERERERNTIVGRSNSRYPCDLSCNSRKIKEMRISTQNATYVIE